MEFPIGKKLFLLVVNPGTSRCPFVSSEHFFLICSRGDQVPDIIACVASVSVLFRESKTRVSMGLTDRRKTAKNLVDSRKN